MSRSLNEVPNMQHTESENCRVPGTLAERGEVASFVSESAELDVLRRVSSEEKKAVSFPGSLLSAVSLIRSLSVASVTGGSTVVAAD